MRKDTKSQWVIAYASGTSLGQVRAATVKAEK